MARVSESDMLFYYKRLLPFKHIFQWISHSEEPTTSFTNREFAYEYPSGAYQRYNSFNNLNEFKNSVIKANPTRFEIGAVYTVNPKQRKILPKSAMKPVEKDLVFDIDLTDYDGIRTCCSGTDICSKCWKFITVGSRVLELALRDDFGFKNLVWVFSGRRGAHCWVSDHKARSLSEQKRRAIIEYLDVISGNRTSSKNGLGLRRPLHPHVRRSLDLLKEKFKDIILEEQDTWADDEAAKKMLLPMISDRFLRNVLEEYWTQHPGRSSIEKWHDIRRLYEENQAKHMRNFSANMFQNMREDIIIETLYPRLDIEVSRQLIHLLKSPFCVHPGTGNVCVPFDAKLMFQSYEANLKGKTIACFDPTNAPNLTLLETELESASNVEEGWNATSLKPYVALFEQFVENLKKDEEIYSRKRKIGEV